MVDASGWEEPRAVIRVDAVKQIMPVRRCRSRVGWCRVFGWFQFWKTRDEGPGQGFRSHFDVSRATIFVQLPSRSLHLWLRHQIILHNKPLLYTERLLSPPCIPLLCHYWFCQSSSRHQRLWHPSAGSKASTSGTDDIPRGTVSTAQAEMRVRPRVCRHHPNHLLWGLGAE